MAKLFLFYTAINVDILYAGWLVYIFSGVPWERAGRIFPRDTYLGFRRMGFNIFISVYAILVIHGTLACTPLPRTPYISHIGQLWSSWSNRPGGRPWVLP